MWFRKRERTFESVLRELVEGLENGTIVLDRSAIPVESPISSPDPARPVEKMNTSNDRAEAALRRTTSPEGSR
jgi:hypothetical protein